MSAVAVAPAIPAPRMTTDPSPTPKVCGLPFALLGDVVDVLTRYGITPEHTVPDRAIGYAAVDLAAFVEAYRAAPAVDGA